MTEKREENRQCGEKTVREKRGEQTCGLEGLDVT